MKVTDPLIVVEQLFDKSISEVWKAITELKQMKEWFFDNIPDFKPEVGFKTQFNVQAPSRNYMHLWEIVEVVTGKKIVYKWSYQDLKGIGLVTFKLFQEDNKTRLKLTNTIIEDFDDSIPEFNRKSCIGGWNYFIQERLVQFLRS